jgi:hypothetical protein
VKRVALTAAVVVLAILPSAYRARGSTPAPAPKPAPVKTFKPTPAQCTALPTLDKLLKAISDCKAKAGTKPKMMLVKSCDVWWRGWPTCTVPTACAANVDQYYNELKGPMAIPSSSAFPSSVGRAEAIDSTIRLGCGPSSPTATDDTVRLTSTTGTHTPTVLLDGLRDKSTTCLNDEVHHAGGDVKVGNLVPPGSCNAEIVTFNMDNTMQLMPRISSWTKNGGDIVPVPQKRALSVPLAIWIVDGPFAARKSAAAMDASRASGLYNAMLAGLTFATTITDVTKVKGASKLLNNGCDHYAGLQALGFKKGQLNAYYVHEIHVATTAGIATPRGWWCGGYNDNMLVLSALTIDRESLAHEIGHAMSLEHTNAKDKRGDDIAGVAAQGISTSNLMVTGGVNRTLITIGQVFRVNVNSKSALNLNRNRTAATRDCPHGSAGNMCPAVSFDVPTK